MMWPYFVDGWNWLGMTATMVLFWGVFIAAIVWLVRAAAQPRGASPDDAMATLRRRLASGEITPDEFENRRRLLHG